MGVGTSRKNEILNFLFGGTSLTPDSTLHLGLKINSYFTTTGELITIPTEPSGGGYARVSITNDGTSWNSSTVNAKTNSIPFTFAESTSAWGDVYGIFLSKVASADVLSDIIYFQNLTSPITVGINTTVYYNAGGLTISIPF
jgi:hypothetical protein